MDTQEMIMNLFFKKHGDNYIGTDSLTNLWLTQCLLPKRLTPILNKKEFDELMANREKFNIKIELLG